MSESDSYASFENYEPSDTAKAFAAYEAAWTERERTGDVGDRHLLEALREREVPESTWRQDTDLGRTLFDAWRAGRRPNRLHGTILRYRWRRLKSVPRQLRKLFSNGEPDHLRIPQHLAKIGTNDDETELDFHPAPIFQSQIARWWDQFDPDAVEADDDHVFPVWLDAGGDPARVPLMVGTEMVGHTAIPGWVNDVLRTATRRGKRAVAHGTLEVERVDGRYRVYSMDLWLPPHPDHD